MLKKRISKSKKFALLKTNNARLLYLMIYPHLDVEGRLEADADLIKGTVLPLMSITRAKIKEYLEDLHKVGLIILYLHNGDLLLEYTRFSDFQMLRKDREADSDIPAPTELQYNSRSTPALSISLSLSKGKDKDICTKLFKEFWVLYPKRKAKQTALKAFEKINPSDELFAVMLEALRKQNLSTDWKKEGGQFIPLPATWLNGRRWEDEIASAKPKLTHTEKIAKGFIEDTPEDWDPCKETIEEYNLRKAGE